MFSSYYIVDTFFTHFIHVKIVSLFKNPWRKFANIRGESLKKSSPTIITNNEKEPKGKNERNDNYTSSIP